jgi:thymidylate kinase
VPAPVEAPRRAGKRSPLDTLAEQLKPEGRKVMFSSRIPEWLDEIVNRKILELKLAGSTKMSKEAILTDALKLYLNIEEPE